MTQVPLTRPTWQSYPAGPLFPRTAIWFSVALAVVVSIAFLADRTGTTGVRILVVGVLVGCLATDLRLLTVAVLAVMPFQQSIFRAGGPANVSATDVLMAMSVLLLLQAMSRRKLRAGPAALPLGLFLAFSALSSAMAWEGRSTLVSIGRNFTVTLVPMMLLASVGPQDLAWRFRQCQRAWVAYTAGAVLLSGFVVYTFFTSGALAAMYALAMHKNAIGPTAGLGMIICLVLLAFGDGLSRPMRRLALTAFLACFAGLLLSFSRGAWVSVFMATAIVLVLSGRYARLVPVAIFGSIALFFLWYFVPDDIGEYATNVSTEAHTIQTRLVSIEQTLDLWKESPWIGHGVGLRKYIAPHNLFVEMLGEVGVVGVLLFLLAVAGAIVTLARAWRRLGKLPGYRPLLLILIGAFSVTLLHGLFDAYWRRGVGAAGWAAVGMAAGLLASKGSASTEPRGRRL